MNQNEYKFSFPSGKQTKILTSQNGQINPNLEHTRETEPIRASYPSDKIAGALFYVLSQSSKRICNESKFSKFWKNSDENRGKSRIIYQSGILKSEAEFLF